jgi:[NiFe] hydrogenase diaphorase moiety small subunit
MSDIVKFKIDGKACQGQKDQTIVQAARDNGIYIPTLCDYEGLPPAATCRICTVKIQGRPTTACTTKISEGLEVACNTAELDNMRKGIVEMLFAGGNHFCPACEKSGNCELQALAYRFQMMVPRYAYLFPQRPVDARDARIYIDRNRCILCRRCVRGVQTKDGKHIFALRKRGNKTEIVIDHKLAERLTDEEALAAMKLCPVGSIIRKGIGFAVPIGKRKFDQAVIGHNIETKSL